MINNLQKLRIEHGETQHDLAKLLGLKTGGAYCKKELGYTQITLKEAYIIATHFHTTIESIFFADERSSKETNLSNTIILSQGRKEINA